MSLLFLDCVDTGHKYKFIPVGTRFYTTHLVVEFLEQNIPIKTTCLCGIRGMKIGICANNSIDKKQPNDA